MTGTRFVAGALACVLGCAQEPILDDDTPLEAPGDPAIETSPPRSRLPEPDLQPLRGVAQHLHARLAHVPAGERVIVTGKVVALRAERGRLGNAEAAITTRATIAVAERWCGDRIGSTIEIAYAGGRLGDLAEYTSQMPRDLERGATHVFVLRRSAGELVLEMGRDDVLRTTFATAADLKEVCR